MKKKSLAIGLLVVVLFFFAAYFSMNSSTPTGQEALATLTSTDFAVFEQAFDKSTDGPRLVLLLSPT